MNGSHKHGSLFHQQLHVALVLAKKDVMIYYLKPPVLIYGLIFPIFFFLAFAVGRPVPLTIMVPGMLAMSLFFTSSAVGPLVTPWERQAKTYERIVTSPASIEAILLGDVLAGMAFGTILSLVPLLLGLIATEAAIKASAELVIGLVLGALVFASLGVLLASPVTETPSQIMMLSNLVRLPLIFVSGVFLPIDKMPKWGQWLAPFSPLSYCADLIRGSFGQTHYFSVHLDIMALLFFATGFLFLARLLHKRARHKAG